MKGISIFINDNEFIDNFFILLIFYDVVDEFNNLFLMFKRVIIIEN